MFHSVYYLDCVQLEKNPTASRYNLVNNSDFRNGATGWTARGTGTADGVAAVQTTVPQLDGNAFQITGSHTGNKFIYQTIPVSGSAGDCFVFSGWAIC